MAPRPNRGGSPIKPRYGKFELYRPVFARRTARVEGVLPQTPESALAWRALHLIEVASRWIPDAFERSVASTESAAAPVPADPITESALWRIAKALEMHIVP